MSLLTPLISYVSLLLLIISSVLKHCKNLHVSILNLTNTFGLSPHTSTSTSVLHIVIATSDDLMVIIFTLRVWLPTRHATELIRYNSLNYPVVVSLQPTSVLIIPTLSWFILWNKLFQDGSGFPISPQNAIPLSIQSTYWSLTNNLTHACIRIWFITMYKYSDPTYPRGTLGFILISPRMPANTPMPNFGTP